MEMTLQPQPDLIDQAIFLSSTDPVPVLKFKIFSGLLKASKGPDGRMRLNGVASSTTRDLHGDTMTESALSDMEKAARNNLTIFLNHSYEVPEDVAGSVTDAKMVARGVDSEGNPNWDLDFQVVMNGANPRAVKAWEAIDNGTKLGLSIGAMIPPGGAVRDKKSGALTINSVELLETSIVGIPANPRSWIENAVKAFNDQAIIEHKAAQTTQLGSPTLTLDGDRYRIEGSFGDMNIQLGELVPGKHMPECNEQCNAETGEHWMVSTTETTTTNSIEITVTDEAKCPDCGKPKSQCDCGDHEFRSLDPDVTDAKVQIITIDTDDNPSSSGGDSSPQGAPRSEPETGDDEVFDSVELGVDADGLHVSDSDIDLTHLSKVVELLRQTTSDLIEAQKQITELTSAKDAAIRERDEAIAQADQVIERTAEIIERLGNTPIGRKASFQAEADKFEHLSGILAPGFLNMLRR